MPTGVSGMFFPAARILSFLGRSLRTKIIAWFFVPTAIILVAVALVNFYSYQDVTEDLVIERDQDRTHLSAVQLETQLEDYTDLLADVARDSSFFSEDPLSQQNALNQVRSRLLVFDGGVLALNSKGTVAAALPESPDIIGQNWSNTETFQLMLRTPGPLFSNILEGGPQGPPIATAAVPVVGERGALLGSLVGRFVLTETAVSSFYGTIVKLRPGQSSRTYLVDARGRVIFHSRADQIGADFSAQPAVRQVLDGQVGAIRTEDFDGADIVAGFAPVPGTPWSLVTEESWSVLTSGSQGYQRFLILLLALGVAVPILFVVIGLRRIMRPLEHLVGAAREVARGNFGQSINVTSRDEIGQLAAEFNLMAAQLKESYQDLEQRVADRTEELRESEERFRALFEDSRDAIFISSDGNVIAANQAALEMFGFTREEANGSVVSDRYADPADQGRFRKAIEAAGSITDFEVKLRRKDGTVMDCLLTASIRRGVDGDGGGEIQGLVRDITQAKRAEEELRQSEERLRNVVAGAPIVLFALNRDGLFTFSEGSGLGALGLEPGEVVGKSVFEIYHDVPQIGENVRRALAGEEFTSTVEAPGLTFETRYSPLRGEDGQVAGVIGVATDITERKKAEDELVEQARELAVLEERNRMAREIHDTLAQGFTGIVLQLEAAEQAMDGSPAEAPGHLTRAKGLARESLQEARRSVWNLPPDTLERLPLGAALQEEVRRFDSEGREKATFSLSGEHRDLPANTQASLLRICQESLTNVRRHAQASNVKVELTFDSKTVSLSVQDDGAGLDSGGATVDGERKGFGLTGMEQRARLLGGSFDIKSRRGKGTQVEVRIPAP